MTHDADAVVPQQIVGKIPDHRPLAVGFADIVEFDEFLPQTAGCRCQLHCVVRLRGVLIFLLLRYILQHMEDLYIMRWALNM